MSTLRVNQVVLNDAGNATISIANSWNVSIVSGGFEIGQFRNNGDFVANNRVLYKSGGATEIAVNTSIEIAFTQANTANATAIASFTQANAVAGAVTTSNTIATNAFAKANAAVANGNTFTGLTISSTRAYMNLISVSDSASINVDFNLGNNFNVTLGGARTLANPGNLTIGQSGVVFISQNGSGGSTLAYGSSWRFPGGTAPTLTSGANAVDALMYFVRASGNVFAQLTSNVA